MLYYHCVTCYLHVIVHHIMYFGFLNEFMSGECVIKHVMVCAVYDTNMKSFVNESNPRLISIPRRRTEFVNS